MVADFQIIGSGSDFSNDLTVFIITCDDGDPRNLQACREALKKQDCKFQFNEIINVAPMDSAFQRMTDLCKTSLYIQVDHDMILYPHAIRSLYERMSVSRETIAIYCMPLWDVHLQKTILGIKIYRHNILKKYPYKMTFSCEMDQVSRMKADGYDTIMIWESFEKSELCLGEHGVYWTPQNIYRRYKRLMEKTRQFSWVGWATILPKEFANRYRQMPDEINLFAFLGAIAGLTSDLNLSQNDELDFTKYGTERDFQRLFYNFNSPQPTELNLYMTTRCNFNCWFCRRNKDKNLTQGSDVSIDYVRKAIERFPSINGVCIAGYGEPLLNDATAAIVSILRTEYKKTVGIVTNGSLLLDNKENLIAAAPHYISVSLNAPTAKEHKEITGSDAFNIICEGIRWFRKNTTIPMGLSYVVTKQNYKSTHAFLDLAGDLDINFIHFINLLPHVADNYDSPEFWNAVITDDDIHVIDFIKSYEGIAKSLIKTYPKPISQKHVPNLCKSPFKTLNMNGDGFIGGCRRIFPPSRDIGHITNQNIWENRWFLDLRNERIGDAPLRDECKMCFGNWMNA